MCDGSLTAELPTVCPTNVRPGAVWVRTSRMPNDPEGRSRSGSTPDSQSRLFVRSFPCNSLPSPLRRSQKVPGGLLIRRMKKGTRPRPGRLWRNPPTRSRLRLLAGTSGVRGKARPTNIYWGPPRDQKGRNLQKKINNVVQSDEERKAKSSPVVEGPTRPFFRPDRLSAQHMALDYAFVRIPVRNGTIQTTIEPSRPVSLSNTAVSHNHTSFILSFTPLPPLPSLRTTATDPTIYQESAANIDLPTAVSDSSQSAPPSSKPASITTPFLVLIAVGAACFLLGIGIVLRVITRPRKKQRIQPSLPIPEKAIDDENEFDSPESPMFGGKERLTATEKNGPLWTWVQYTKRESLDVAEKGESRGVDGTSSLPFNTSARPLATVSEGEALTLAPSRAQKRSSYTSVRDNGIADGKAMPLFNASQPTSLTGDGHRVLQRLSKVRDLRRSQSYFDPRDLCLKRDSVYRPDSAYDGADVSSPVAYYQPVSTPMMAFTPAGGTEGRARIQSAYFAHGTYPRTSSVPGTYSINTATKINLAQAQAYSLNTKTNRDWESRSDKELGLIYSDAGSPSPSFNITSPQPTLHPDDSLSVIGSRCAKRSSHNAQRSRESRRFSKLYNGEAGTRADLPTKSLLEMEFDVTRMSLSDIAVQPVADARSATGAAPVEKALSRGRNDRPPRVPSPPPMPSLAQMAFAHGNPDAYNNYHSPTYSLYGLYGDRKSVATAIAR